MAKNKETRQLNFQRSIDRAYIEVIRSEPSKTGVFQREHNLLSHCIYFNPLSVQRAAGQAWPCAGWSEITYAGGWCHRALTSFWLSNAMGSITREMCPVYLLHPYQDKSTGRGSAQPLGHRSHSGHCDSTISLSLLSAQALTGTAWSMAKSHFWPWSKTLAVSTSLCPRQRRTHSLGYQKGKPPLLCRGLWQGAALRDTFEYPQWTGSSGLSRIYFKASVNRARVRSIHSPPCSSSSLLKLWGLEKWQL